jgi:hypothetical protein
LIKEKKWVLTANDRCDGKNCFAQAYIKATGVSGDLFFCSHHYEDIVNSSSGYEKMMNFAYEIVDERERLIENRSVGHDR